MMEEAANISRFSSLIPDGQGRIEKRLIRKSREENDRIQQVRFAHAVRTRDAGERTEGDIYIYQVFESGGAQPREHYN